MASDAPGPQSSELFKEGLFNGTVWVVTGGGTGIGLEIAFQAATLGANIAICGRRKEPLESAAALIESKTGKKVFYATCDTRSSDAVKAYVEAVLQHFGAIHVLINNAGGQYVSLAENVTPKGFDAVVRNNLSGTWNFIYHVANLAFIPQNNGTIVNIIAQIKRGFPGMIHTGAARAGVDNLTKTLAVEWSKYGIRTNSIAPGVIDSSGTTKYVPEFLAAARDSAPLRRTGTVKEVSHLTMFLASEKTAGFITGQTYYVDGGQSIGSDIFAFGLPPAKL